MGAMDYSIGNRHKNLKAILVISRPSIIFQSTIIKLLNYGLEEEDIENGRDMSSYANEHFVV